MLIMKYFVRSIKYLLFLCVLDVVLVWLMSFDKAAVDADLITLVRLQLSSENGLWLVVAFVVLAALYPLFGFMRRRIAECDIVVDELRIMNAMQTYGFKLAERRDGVLSFRKEGFVGRLTLMFEDEIVVRRVDGGVELVGLRRSVARVAYQLECYIDRRRYEDKE